MKNVSMCEQKKNLSTEISEISGLMLYFIKKYRRMRKHFYDREYNKRSNKIKRRKMRQRMIPVMLRMLCN